MQCYPDICYHLMSDRLLSFVSFDRLPLVLLCYHRGPTAAAVHVLSWSLGAIGNQMMSFLVYVLHVMSCDIQCVFLGFCFTLDRYTTPSTKRAARCAGAVWLNIALRRKKNVDREDVCPCYVLSILYLDNVSAFGFVGFILFKFFFISLVLSWSTLTKDPPKNHHGMHFACLFFRLHVGRILLHSIQTFLGAEVLLDPKSFQDAGTTKSRTSTPF